MIRFYGFLLTRHCHAAARYKFKHAGAPKFDFPLHCWWCESEQNVKSEMVQVRDPHCWCRCWEQHFASRQPSPLVSVDDFHLVFKQGGSTQHHSFHIFHLSTNFEDMFHFNPPKMMGRSTTQKRVTHPPTWSANLFLSGLEGLDVCRF